MYSRVKPPILDKSVSCKKKKTLLFYWCSERDLNPHDIKYQGIFLLLYVAIAALLRCSLDYFFSISYDLGGRYIVSTHLRFLNRFSSSLPQRGFRRISRHSLRRFLFLVLCLYFLIMFARTLS